MKLTNVRFRTPISIGGFSHEHIQRGEGDVEMLDFPWVRVTRNGKSRRTTVFNICDVDDWEDPTPEEQAAEREQVRANRERGKKPG